MKSHTASLLLVNNRRFLWTSLWMQWRPHSRRLQK